MSFATKLMDLGAGFASGFAESFPVGMRQREISRNTAAGNDLAAARENRIATDAERQRIRTLFEVNPQAGIAEAERIGDLEYAQQLRSEFSGATDTGVRGLATGLAGATGAANIAPGSIQDEEAVAGEIGRLTSAVGPLREEIGRSQAEFEALPAQPDGQPPEVSLDAARQFARQRSDALDLEESLTGKINVHSILLHELQNLQPLASREDFEDQLDNLENAVLATGRDPAIVQGMRRSLIREAGDIRNKLGYEMVKTALNSDEIVDLQNKLELDPLYRDLAEVRRKGFLFKEAQDVSEQERFQREQLVDAYERTEAQAEIMAIVNPDDAEKVYQAAADALSKYVSAEEVARYRIGIPSRIQAIQRKDLTQLMSSIFNASNTLLKSLTMKELVGKRSNEKLTMEDLASIAREVKNVITPPLTEDKVTYLGSTYSRALDAAREERFDSIILELETILAPGSKMLGEGERARLIEVFRGKGYNFDPATGKHVTDQQSAAPQENPNDALSFLPQGPAPAFSTRG